LVASLLLLDDLAFRAAEDEDRPLVFQVNAVHRLYIFLKASRAQELMRFKGVLIDKPLAAGYKDAPLLLSELLEVLAIQNADCVQPSFHLADELKARGLFNTLLLELKLNDVALFGR